jgi:hypothetical protein
MKDPVFRPLASWHHGKVWIFVGAAYSALSLAEAKALRAKLDEAIAVAEKEPV